MRRTYIFDKELSRVIPAAEWYERHGEHTDSTGHVGNTDIEAFKSPIDGSIITNQKQLREHNMKHGVTDARDYSQQYFDAKAKERKANMAGTSPAVKRQRYEMLRAEMARRGH
jgi:hypothetical protein